jgi:hypothetical protein
VSIIKSFVGLTAIVSGLMGAIAPAQAQWRGSEWGNYHRSDNVIVGDRVYVGPSDSLLINGHRGYYPTQPSTVIIIQQTPSYYQYPVSTCSTSVAGSPIPLPYARDSRTGAICN